MTRGSTAIPKAQQAFAAGGRPNRASSTDVISSSSLLLRKRHNRRNAAVPLSVFPLPRFSHGSRSLPSGSSAPKPSYPYSFHFPLRRQAPRGLPSHVTGCILALRPLTLPHPPPFPSPPKACHCHVSRPTCECADSNSPCQAKLMRELARTRSRSVGRSPECCSSRCCQARS